MSILSDSAYDKRMTAYRLFNYNYDKNIKYGVLLIDMIRFLKDNLTEEEFNKLKPSKIINYHILIDKKAPKTIKSSWHLLTYYVLSNYQRLDIMFLDLFIEKVLKDVVDHMMGKKSDEEPTVIKYVQCINAPETYFNMTRPAYIEDHGFVSLKNYGAKFWCEDNKIIYNKEKIYEKVELDMEKEIMKIFLWRIVDKEEWNYEKLSELANKITDDYGLKFY